jgi:hypothetical protein
MYPAPICTLQPCIYLAWSPSFLAFAFLAGPVAQVLRFSKILSWLNRAYLNSSLMACTSDT